MKKTVGNNQEFFPVYTQKFLSAVAWKFQV